jgi:hypothetical protein
MQLVDFSSIRVISGESGGFSGDEWNPDSDIIGFGQILCEIVGANCMDPNFGDSDSKQSDEIPTFVLSIIRDCLSDKSRQKPSFIFIYMILKQHGFEILSDVDMKEVLGFVKLIESTEESYEID